jgi:hypothetical protein
MVVLKAVALCWRAESWCHVKAAVVMCAQHAQHLFTAARRCGCISQVGHDAHGLKVEHLQHSTARRQAMALSTDCLKEQGMPFLSQYSVSMQQSHGPHLLPVPCVCCQFARQVVLPFPSAGGDAPAGLKTLTKLVCLHIAEQERPFWRG